MPFGSSPISPRRVGPNRIEITQKRNPPTGIGLRHVAQDIFDHQLRTAIRVACGQTGNLRESVRDAGSPYTVAEEAEHHSLHSGVGHALARARRYPRRCCRNSERLCHRLADRFQTGEVDHALDNLSRKDVFQGSPVQQVDLAEFQGFPGNFPRPCSMTLRCCWTGYQPRQFRGRLSTAPGRYGCRCNRRRR